MYTSGTNLIEIQPNLQNSIEFILSWCTVNNLLVDPNKTKCMLIVAKYKLRSTYLDLNVNKFCIENVESHEILGVYVDKHLSWNFHI